MFLRYISFAILIIVIGACKQKTVLIPPAYQPTSAYEGYRHGLVEAGLGGSALTRIWLEEGHACLDRPAYIRLPHKEAMYFDDLHPEAYTYRMRTKRGQKIAALLSPLDSSRTKVFMDLYQVTADTSSPYFHIATADSTLMLLEFEPQVDGEYILRLQPELLASGRFTLEIKDVPVFAFPMSGRTETAILSIFGAERDAGRRIHEGNDIFARRGTPIIAATSGIVSSTGNKGLGGKQAYIRDSERNLAVYFAHLDSVYVNLGDQVNKGDTIGENGNSGNAATTNPHLHFGIYSENGAIDPYHYIVPNRRPERPIKADISWTGHQVRTKNKAYFDNISSQYRNRRDSVPIHTIMTAKAAWSRSYRVELPDGRTGYVRSGDLTLATNPYRKRKAQSNLLLYREYANTIIVDSLEQESQYDVLGRFEDHFYIEANDRQGWIARR